MSLALWRLRWRIENPASMMQRYFGAARAGEKAACSRHPGR
jgi:hypothetical protein